MAVVCTTSSGRNRHWTLLGSLLGTILGLTANPGAAVPPADADNARLAAPAAVIESRLGLVGHDEESYFRKLLEARRGLLAKRAALDTRQAAARNEWFEATAEINQLEPQRRALRRELAFLESLYIVPLGRHATAQRAENKRITKQLRQVTAQYNELDATAMKALGRRQAAVTQQSDALRDLQDLDRESDALSRQWLARLDFLRLRSRAEHEALGAMFSKLIESDPDHPGAILGRGLAAWKLGRFEDAANAFHRAITLDEGCAASALAALGRLECETGKTSEGQTDFAQAYKMARTNSRLYLLRGMALAAEKDYPAAQRDFETANRSSDVASDGFRLLALLHAAWSTSPADPQAQLAVDDADRACKLTDFKNWACLDALAVAHAAAGQFEDAIKTAGQAADLALDDNRQSCLEHQRHFTAHELPQIDWH